MLYYNKYCVHLHAPLQNILSDSDHRSCEVSSGIEAGVMHRLDKIVEEECTVSVPNMCLSVQYLMSKMLIFNLFFSCLMLIPKIWEKKMVQLLTWTHRGKENVLLLKPQQDRQVALYC